jgi:flagellar biosynthesis protein
MKHHSANSNAKTSNKHATALQYNPQNNTAPTVVAKGENALAEDIIALAQQHGVLIHEDPHLAKILNSLDIGQSVPQEIFIVVAELVAFSYVLQGKFPENWQGSSPINTKA